MLRASSMRRPTFAPWKGACQDQWGALRICGASHREGGTQPTPGVGDGEGPPAYHGGLCACHDAALPLQSRSHAPTKQRPSSTSGSIVSGKALKCAERRTL
jgi:hypothetical protein